MAEAGTLLGPQFPPLKHEDCNDPDAACPTLQESNWAGVELGPVAGFGEQPLRPGSAHLASA